MKVSTEQGADRQAIVRIEVEPAELEQALDRAYRRVVRQVNINGFRPGKAPRRIVEQRLGRGVLVEEAARDLVPKLTNDAAKDQALDIIAEPEIEITGYDPLSFTATFPLRPTVTLGDYTAIRLPPREVEVTEEQIDQVMQRLRDQRGTWITPAEPRPAAAGDRVTFEMASATSEGETVQERQTGLTAVLGEAMGLLPELDQAMVGLAVGDTTQTTTTFPEDYRQSALAGKEVIFDITLTGLEERELPELDDTFASAVSDLSTLDDLRARVRTNLETQARDEARQQMSQALMNLVAEQATIEMPPVLVEDQIERQLQERRQVFERQGIKWERVLQLTNQTEEQVRDDERPEAERRVRGGLALVEVAKAEHIEVTPEEIEAEIDRLAGTYADPVQARRTFERAENRQAVQSSLFERRIIDRLIEIATEGHGYAVAPGQVPVLAGLSAVLAAEPEGEAMPLASAEGEPAAEAPPAEAEAPPAEADAPSATPRA